MAIQHGYAKAFAITPSDTLNHERPCEAIYVGGAGNVTAIVAGVAVTFTAPPVGSIIPVKNSRVNLTGTTATLLVGLQGF